MTPVLGASVGPYRLEEVVASDVLGTVHRARDERSGRHVLIRLMLPLAQDPEAVRRFRIELPAIARLDHPNVLRVEEWGEYEGVPYVVTADAPSRRLSDLRAVGHRLDPRLVLRVLRDLAAALDYAHLAGVVHGAVEPGRVLLGADGAVRLTDFGLTLLAGATPETDVQALAAIGRDLLPGARVAAVLDPQRRWESCGALVDALEVALGARPPAATPAAAPPWQGLLERLGPLPGRWPLWVGLGGGAFAVVLLAIVLLVHLLRPGPTMALSVAQAQAGTNVTVTGGNLPAGQPGTIVLAGRTLGEFRADEHGAFSYRFVVPPDLAGSRQIQVCWGGTCPLSQQLLVLAEPTPSPGPTPIPAPVQTLPAPTPSAGAHRFTPSISLSRRTPRRGETITVTGRGFDPAEQYVILLDQGGRRVVLQAPESPDGKGSFKSSVRIPSDAGRGLAVVSACISQAGGQLGACGQSAVLIG